MTNQNRGVLEDPPRVEPERLGGMPRWAVYGGRMVLWVLLAALVGLGIAGILTSGSVSQPVADPAEGWPTGQAESLALREADRWLTTTTASGGQLELSSLTVAEVAIDGGRATVTVAARLPDADVGGEVGRRWLHVAVPVHRQGGRVGLAGTPALVAAPAVAGEIDAPSGEASAPRALVETVRGWAEAYAAGGPGLSRWTTTDSPDPVGLAGQVAFEDVTTVRAVDDPGDGQATVLADVRWQLTASGEAAGASGDGPVVLQTYRLELVRDGGRWYVRQVSVGYPSSNTEE